MNWLAEPNTDKVFLQMIKNVEGIKIKDEQMVEFAFYCMNSNLFVPKVQHIS